MQVRMTQTTAISTMRALAGAKRTVRATRAEYFAWPMCMGPGPNMTASAFAVALGERDAAEKAYYAAREVEYHAESVAIHWGYVPRCSCEHFKCRVCERAERRAQEQTSALPALRALPRRAGKRREQMAEECS